MAKKKSNTFVADRSTLLTGAALKAYDPNGHSGMLYDSAVGCSCIVGQYLNKACGVPLKALDGMGSAEDLGLPNEAAWLMNERGDSSEAAQKIFEANDAPKLHQVRREAKLTKLFAQQEINLSFTGSYAEATRRVKQSLKKTT